MSNSAIIIEGVSKAYRRGKVRRGDLKNTWSDWWSPTPVKESFYALDNIDLRIGEGEVVGLIGPNGAGKSTLLKLLSRITFPTKGRMEIRGTLSSMLEVGTGFHPELTGRENIFLNGAIIGMKRNEVSRKLDSIVAFSGIAEFLDTPVKHYSSGMYVRLAFSVAAHLEPDILLIDEVLAVGDRDFRSKCMNKLLDVSGHGRTIIMVSHQMSYLQQLCQNGIYLDQGRVRFQGPIDETIGAYVRQAGEKAYQSLASRKDRRGNGIVQATHIEMVNDHGQTIYAVTAGQAVTFRIHLENRQAEAYNVTVQLEFMDLYGQIWFVAGNLFNGEPIVKMEQPVIMTCHIPRLPLNTQMYSIHVHVVAGQKLSDEVMNAMTIEVEPGLFYSSGRLPPASKGILADYEWKVEPAPSA